MLHYCEYFFDFFKYKQISDFFLLQCYVYLFDFYMSKYLLLLQCCDYFFELYLTFLSKNQCNLFDYCSAANISPISVSPIIKHIIYNCFMCSVFAVFKPVYLCVSKKEEVCVCLGNVAEVTVVMPIADLSFLMIHSLKRTVYCGLDDCVPSL